MDIPGTTHNFSLLLYTTLAVMGLVLLIALAKVNAFVSLTIAAVFVGLCSGLNPPDIVKAYAEGVGATLAGIAAVVGLGTMLGKMLGESGGAEVIANTLIRLLGEKRLHWTMLLVGVIVGIPVWFTVGVVLLVPVVFTIVRETGVPLLRLAIPLVAGLSVAHGLVPPHPGPMVAIELLGADAGKTILYSLIVGVPAAVVGGPMLVGWMVRRVPVDSSAMTAPSATKSARASLPGFWLTLLTILLPVLLMLLATVADMTLVKTSRARQWIDFLGSPLMAMLVAVFIRVATGSATVAITTATGILAPIVAKTPGTNLELLVVAMGAGSLILSHLNDGGFWFVKEYLGLSVSQTIKTWTIVETVISVVALILVLLLNRIV